MKLIILLFALSLIGNAHSSTYDKHNIEFNKYVNLSQQSNKLRIKRILNILEEYNNYINDVTNPLLQQTFEVADKSNIRLLRSQNIPVLITVSSGCLDNAIKSLEKIKSKTLTIDNLHVYAEIMSCTSPANLYAEEMKTFMRGNKEFLKQNELLKKVSKTARKAYIFQNNLHKLMLLYLGKLSNTTEKS